MPGPDTGLRRPIWVEISAKTIKLVTIGHVAVSLQRCTWTIRRYEETGLLPPAAFILNGEIENLRRRLYLDEYVDRLAKIAQEEYVGKQLAYADWGKFQRQAHEAYRETVEPLLPPGVTPPVAVVCRRKRADSGEMADLQISSTTASHVSPDGSPFGSVSCFEE